jgi:hypothetical protein
MDDRDLGQSIGYAFADVSEGDPVDLKPLVDQELSDSTVEAVKELFIGPEGLEDEIKDPVLFWDGFRAGVAAWLLDQGITKDTPRPPAWEA